MNYLLKLSAVCLVCALLSLTLKKTSPELSMLIGIAFVIGCIFTALEIFLLIRSRRNVFFSLTEDQKLYFEPLFKCCGISIVTQISTGICKDAGQAAAASAFELVGALVSVWCTVPLLELLLQIIEGLL